MEKIIEFALQCQKNQLTVFPGCNGEKFGVSKAQKWNIFTAREAFLHPSVNSVAIQCGKTAGNLQVIQIECRTEEQKEKFSDFLALICQESTMVYNQLVILSTSARKQIYFRNDNLSEEGWLRLASDNRGCIVAYLCADGVAGIPFPDYEFVLGDFSAIPHFNDTIKTMLINRVKQVFDASEPDREYSLVPENLRPEPLAMLPIEGFPEKIQWIINEFARVYKSPRDFWAGSVLSAIGLAIGNKMMLKEKYENYPVFWTVLVGDVSLGKSLPMDVCLNWFRTRDSQSIKDYKKAMAEYRDMMNMTLQERRSEGCHEKPVEPKCFQYILNDYTPEALVQAHEVNTRGMMAARDELKGWLDDFDRYNKSGEQPNMLSAWSCIPISYNRKTAGVMHIEKPVIHVMGGIQPDLLPLLASDHRADNGFLSRFMMGYPDNAAKADYTEEILDEKVITEWEGILSRLATLEETAILRLSREAHELYKIWYNVNANRTNEEKSGYLKGVFSKLDIISLRVAVAVHGMFVACGESVSDEITMGEMKTALDIADYFRATSLKVYRKIFDDHTSELDLKRIADYLIQQGVAKSEVARIMKTSRSQVERYLKKALRLSA